MTLCGEDLRKIIARNEAMKTRKNPNVFNLIKPTYKKAVEKANFYIDEVCSKNSPSEAKKIIHQAHEDYDEKMAKATNCEKYSHYAGYANAFSNYFHTGKKMKV